MCVCHMFIKPVYLPTYLPIRTSLLTYQSYGIESESKRLVIRSPDRDRSWDRTLETVQSDVEVSDVSGREQDDGDRRHADHRQHLHQQTDTARQRTCSSSRGPGPRHEAPDTRRRDGQTRRVRGSSLQNQSCPWVHFV